MRGKSSWREKLVESQGLPVVQRSEHKLPQWQGMMLIPSPQEVDAMMRLVPEGRLTTINEIRHALAKKHDADFACPMTTGVFAWIAAHAAEEAAAEGEPDTTPYWRTLKTNGELNPKYPGGVDALVRKLEAEGHTVSLRGKRYIVEDLKACLCDEEELLAGVRESR